MSMEEMDKNSLKKFLKWVNLKHKVIMKKTNDWDIKIGNNRIEIKSTTFNCNGSFHHDGLHKTNNYDFVFFIVCLP